MSMLYVNAVRYIQLKLMFISERIACLTKQESQGNMSTLDEQILREDLASNLNQKQVSTPIKPLPPTTGNVGFTDTGDNRGGGDKA